MNRRLPILLSVLVLLLLLLRASTTGASTAVGVQPAWANPSAKTLKRASTQIGAQHESNYFNNLDCNLIDYRVVGSSTMQTSCFAESAYGLFSTDQAMVIYNGTDEALPLLPYSPTQILVPWPKALNLVSLGVINTGGMYLSVYKNPLNVIQDVRNAFGQLTAKQLTGPPDLMVKDADGKPLQINAQTLTFSDNGSWLVAETLTGTFVRINLATLSQVSFAPSFGMQGSSALLNSMVAISDDGHFVAIHNRAAGTFKVYDLTNCPATSNNCPSYDYLPFIGQQISGVKWIQHVRFVNKGLISFEAVTINSANSGIYQLAPSEGIGPLIDYLGLGDSFTSGEGAFNYNSGTDLTSNMCHMSAKSYPLLLARDLFSPLGGRSVACSGAVIRDVSSASESYRGQVQGGLTFSQLSENEPALLGSVMTNFVPGYVAQQRFASQYQPRSITVSVGGDDIGFGAILQNCVVPHLSRHLSDSVCFNTYEDRLELTKLIDRTAPHLTSLYKQLQTVSPSSQIYAIGYPSITVDTGNCGLNVHLSQSELEFAQEIVNYLNAAVERSAKLAGIKYVDVSNALAGHRLCETASYNVAVNGLTAGKDGGAFGLKLFGKESYHPNALGHQLIEQAILKQTHNLTVAPVSSTPTPVPAATKLLNAPKSGRKVNTVIPDAHLIAPVVKRGKTTTFSATGASSGLKANTRYTIRLNGASGVAIGTMVSDINANLSGPITIPESVADGGHTIDLTGENQAGEPVDVTQPIYIPTSDTDADGDGIADTYDSCPSATNSGIDADEDGIDDACDAVIGQPPADLSPPSSLASITPTTPLTPSGQGNVSGGRAGILYDQAVTIAASLHTPSSARSSPTSTGQVLGVNTYSPEHIHGGNLSDGGQDKLNHSSPKPNLLRGLPHINWLRWAVLPIVAWLLILLVATICWRSAVQYAHGWA